MNHETFKRRAGVRALAFLALLFLIGAARDASATFRVWQGTNGVQWSTPANWSPAGAPQNGDDLHFPNAAANLTSSNDIAGLALNSILINAPMYLRGLTVNVTNGISSSVLAVGSVTIEFPVVLRSDQPFYSQHRDVYFAGGIDLNGRNLTFDVTGDNDSRIYIFSSITGVGSIRKTSPGILWFQSSGNTFTGPLRVTDGSLLCNTFGAAVNTRLEIAGPGRVQLLRANQILDSCSVVLEDNGQLLLNGFSEALSGSLELRSGAIIDGGGNYTNGGLHLLSPTVLVRTTNAHATIRNGLLSLDIPQVRFDIDGLVGFSLTGTLDITANLVGSGGFTTTNIGTLHLYGTNSFDGEVLVKGGGDVIAHHATSFGATNSGVVITNGSITLSNVNIGLEPLTVYADNYGSGDPPLTLLRGTGLSTFGNCSWAGPVTLNTNLFLYISSTANRLILSGPITGPGGIDAYLGTLQFAGTEENTFTGSLRAFNTRVELNKPSNINAYVGELVVGGYPFMASSEVRWLHNYQNLTLGLLTIHTNGFVNLNGNAQDFGHAVFNGGLLDTGPAGGVRFLLDVTTNPTNVIAGIRGQIYLTDPRNWFINDGPARPDLQIDALVRDSTAFGYPPGGFIKRGAGELALMQANIYTGPNIVQEGVLLAGNDTALGTTNAGAGTFVQDGATLQLEGLISGFGETLNIIGAGRGGTNGALYSLNGCPMGGPIILDDASTIRVDSTNTPLFIAATISGTGPLTKSGVGFLTFGGPANNTYSGETFVNAGRLTLQKPVGVTAVPSHLAIGSGPIGSSATVLHMQSFAIIGAVTVNRGGLWNLNGFAEGWSIPDLQGRPPLRLNDGGDVQTGAGSFFLPVGGDVVVDPGLVNNALSSISGNIGLDPGPHRFIVGSGLSVFGTDPECDISAAISQTSTAADIIKEGAGEMRLGGNNTFTGAATVDAGTLIISNNAALGTSAGGTMVVSNGALVLDGGRVITGEPLALDSASLAALKSINGSNTWNATVQLSRDARIDVNGSISVLTLSNTVSGAGGLTKVGAGTLILAGASANTYTGLTFISNGLLLVRKALNTLGVPGDVVLGDPLSPPTNAILRARLGNLSMTAHVALHRSGLLDVINALDPGVWVGTLTGDGQVNIPTGESFTVGNNSDFDFNGFFTGSGIFNKEGFGTMQLRGSSPAFTGNMHIYYGTLLVAGSWPGATLTPHDATTVGGNGEVGHLNAQGTSTVAPGPGVFGQLGDDLRVNVLDFSAASTFHVEFFGPLGNDSLDAAPPIDLGGAQLKTALKYPPREGDMLRLINNRGVSAITGTFSNLANGATFGVSNVFFVIRYNGGDGNDVTLTVTNLPLRAGGFQLTAGQLGNALVPNDCSLLSLVVTNRILNNVIKPHGTLRSLTPGLVVTFGESDYPDLGPNGRVTNLQPFQVRTEPWFPCGSNAIVELTLTASNASPLALLYTLNGTTNCGPQGGICEGCHVVSGALTNKSLVTAQRIVRTAVTSACFPAKPCPGTVTNFDSDPWYCATHAFTNTASHEVCVTAQLRYECPVQSVNLQNLVAYLDAFDPNDACAKYLGDDAVGTNGWPMGPFSFRVPGGARFEIVAIGSPTDLDCTRYTIEVFGLPCPDPALRIAGAGASGTPVFVQWSSAYPEWRLQSIDALGDTTPFPFTNATQPPVMLDGKYTVTNDTPGSARFYRLGR